MSMTMTGLLATAVLVAMYVSHSRLLARQRKRRARAKIEARAAAERWMDEVKLARQRNKPVCQHNDTVQVESLITHEVLAYLCLSCNAQVDRPGDGVVSVP